MARRQDVWLGRGKQQVRRWVHAVLGMCWAVAFSCGGSTGSNHGGETHWLAPCSSSSECGGELACSCGVCTRPCSAATECDDLAGDAVCSAAAGTEFASKCSSAELEQSFCVAGGSLASGGSAGASSEGGAGAPPGGTGAAPGGGGLGGSSDLPDGTLNICQDVPDACDSGPCFTVCGVNVAIVDAPQPSGFIIDPQPALYGAITDLGDLTLSARGSRWLVSEADSSEPAGELVYPGLTGPFVAGDRVFLLDSLGNLLHMNLQDPALPVIEERWAPDVDSTYPEEPRPAARVRGVSRGELVFEVGHSVSFVDVSGESPRELGCVELMEEPGANGSYELLHVSDDVIVQLTPDEESERWIYSIYDRDGDGEVLDTIEAQWESPAHFWQDRMAIYGAGDTPLVALYELSTSGAEQLGEAAFPDGASNFSWDSRVIAGLIVFEDSCDATSCGALDIASDPPLQDYAVDEDLRREDACTGEAIATAGGPDFWLAPRLYPNQRFVEAPDVDCGPTEHVSWKTIASTWSPDGTELALYGYDTEGKPWLRIWEPGTDDAFTLPTGDAGDFALDALWWTGDYLIGHAGTRCDEWHDWLYLYDMTDPEDAPTRVDLPGPMLDMDVSAGAVMALGLNGPYDCSLSQPEPPKTLWSLNVGLWYYGFTEIALPEGADPEQVASRAGLKLIGNDRIDALELDGQHLQTIDFTSPYDPVTVASGLGLFLHSKRLQHLESLAWNEFELIPETAACSERFPVAADMTHLYLSSRVPGGPHQVPGADLTRVVAEPVGNALEVDVVARLPWGQPAAVAVSDEGRLAVTLPHEILILR